VQLVLDDGAAAGEDAGAATTEALLGMLFEKKRSPERRQWLTEKGNLADVDA
jgi:hypothetical protein